LSASVPVAVTRLDQLPRAALSARPTFVASQTLFIFKKQSSYPYPTLCVENEVVVYLNSNGNSPPVHVKFIGGNFWVNYEDLIVIPNVTVHHF
jgi:hypothetical protein